MQAHAVRCPNCLTHRVKLIRATAGDDGPSAPVAVHFACFHGHPFCVEYQQEGQSVSAYTVARSPLNAQPAAVVA